RDDRSRDQFQTGQNDQERNWSAEGRQQTYSDQGVLGIDLEDQDGAVVVTNLWPGSPAEQAGLRSGDEIVSIGDQDVEEQSDLREALRDYRPWAPGRLTLSRDGEERHVRVRLGSRQELTEGSRRQDSD